MKNIIKKIINFNLAYYKDFDKAEIEKFINSINFSNKKRVILFTSFDYAIDPFRQCMPYICNEYDIFIIFTNTIQKNWRNKFSKNIISIKRNFKILEHILKSSEYNLILIGNIGLFWNWHFPFIKMFSKSPIICYERDFCSLFHIKDINILSEVLRSKERALFEIECEKMLLTESNGIVMHFGGEAKDTVKKINPNVLFFLPFRDPEENVFNELKENSIKKLVYGGSLTPDNKNDMFQNWSKMNLIFKNIIKYFHIEVFSYYFDNSTNWENYRKIKNLKMKKPLSVEKFIKYISDKFIGGLCLLNFENFNYNINSAPLYIYPTKIFTYLSAGLPVIISSEFIEASKFLKNNNLGIALPFNEIKNFKKDTINIHQLESIKNSILKFNFQISFHTEINKFKKFFRKISGE